MDKPQAITKVQLLLRLAAGAEGNESEAAKTMAQQIIEKYGLTEEEYLEKEVKPLYQDDALLFEEVIPQDWTQQLALICGNKFDCYVIKEDNHTVGTEDHTFKLFVYGHDDDVVLVKQLWQLVYSQIEELVEKNCDGRSSLYRTSYAEGAVNGVRQNIECESFDVEGLVKVAPEEKEAPKETQAIEKIKQPKKEQPIAETTKIRTEEKPIDFGAWVRGENDAMSRIHIGKREVDNLLDDENEGLWNRLLGMFGKDNYETPEEYDDEENF